MSYKLFIPLEKEIKHTALLERPPAPSPNVPHELYYWMKPLKIQSYSDVKPCRRVDTYGRFGRS